MKLSTYQLLLKYPNLAPNINTIQDILPSEYTEALSLLNYVAEVFSLKLSVVKQIKYSNPPSFYTHIKEKEAIFDIIYHGADAPPSIRIANLDEGTIKFNITQHREIRNYIAKLPTRGPR